MNYPISIIIPTYKSPSYLDLCIQSIVNCQFSKSNQITVVVDGTYDTNKDIITKWKNEITPIILETNAGQNQATNQGVFHSIYDKILILNDDNVVCKDFDKILTNNYIEKTVTAPNQIEHKPSIFSSFVITEQFGTNINTFDLNKFIAEEPLYRKDRIQLDGNTLPIFMSKLDYISVGGWDIEYPSGMVTDLDFFLKCRLNGMKMIRNMKLNIFHFGSVSMSNLKSSTNSEQLGWEYFKFKWGKLPHRDAATNSIII